MELISKHPLWSDRATKNKDNDKKGWWAEQMTLSVKTELISSQKIQNEQKHYKSKQITAVIKENMKRRIESWQISLFFQHHHSPVHPSRASLTVIVPEVRNRKETESTLVNPSNMFNFITPVMCSCSPTLQPIFCIHTRPSEIEVSPRLQSPFIFFRSLNTSSNFFGSVS